MAWRTHHRSLEISAFGMMGSKRLQLPSFHMRSEVWGKAKKGLSAELVGAITGNGGIGESGERQV